MHIRRKPYPSDVGTGEWSLVAPCLLSQRADAGRRKHDLRMVVSGLYDIVKTGAPERRMPTTFGPGP